MGKKTGGGAAKARQAAILAILRKDSEITSNSMAKLLGVQRGTIINDIAELRKRGYPIQVSSMKTEDGMYVVVYEMAKYPPKP
jgi:predicted DNA-binding transcriptional regulator YafY